MPLLRMILLFFLTGKNINEEEEDEEEDDDDIDDDELRHLEELDSEDLGDDGDVGPVLQVNKVFIQNFIYDKLPLQILQDANVPRCFSSFCVDFTRTEHGSELPQDIKVSLPLCRKM